MEVSAEQNKQAQSLMKKFKKSHVYVTKDNKMFFSKTGALVQCNDKESDMVKVEFEAKKEAETDTEETGSTKMVVTKSGNEESKTAVEEVNAAITKAIQDAVSVETEAEAKKEAKATEDKAKIK